MGTVMGERNASLEQPQTLTHPGTHPGTHPSTHPATHAQAVGTVMGEQNASPEGRLS
jgi:hypothetical protein